MAHKPRLRRSAAAALTAATAAVVIVGLGAGAGHAGTTLPAALAKFANCPVQNTAVTACYYIETTSATLDAGSFSGITSTDPMVLQFGGIPNLDTGTTTTVAPANGVSALTSPALHLPGGILHMPWADGGPLEAYITPQIIGLPQLNLDNLTTTTNAPVLTLSMKAKVSNPFTNVLSALGNGCYIGSNSSPITLNLTTGTTNPPGPNQPVTGASGTFDFSQIGSGVIKITGQTVVDNAWSLPHASGCGLLGSLNWAIDLDDGQAGAGAGHNAATMNTTIYQANADAVRAAEGLPTVGS